jgi:hypothetical protein
LALQAAAQHWTCATNHLLFFDLKTMNETQAAEVGDWITATVATD